MFNDGEECYRACESGDPRFDGMFYVAVTSTKIYCRPSCPARTPLRKNCRFYPSAAAAQLNGFRACKRCRPDSVPGSPEWRVRGDVAARAVRLIADGVVDREGVVGLAVRLAYSERHLNRLLHEELGAGALALARAQRAQTARTLIETTALTFTEIAYAAGFGSIRQFNDTIVEVYASTPTQLRVRTGASGRGVLSVRLAFRSPFDALGIFRFLSVRSLPGVEVGSFTNYARILNLANGTGVASVVAGDGALFAALQLDDMRDVSPMVSRLRRLFDLDADPVSIDRVLRGDRAMQASLRRTPGLRVPGAVDGFEMAVRAIVGQQVSVAGARTVTGRIVARCGNPHLSTVEGLTLCFPTAEAVATADLDGIGMPTTRIATVQRVAQAVASGDIVLEPWSDPASTRQSLLALKGVGPWTADYIAMRALGDPDAFLATDLGVRKGAAALGIDADLDQYSQRWRPFRSYALMHCWNALGETTR